MNKQNEGSRPADYAVKTINPLFSGGLKAVQMKRGNQIKDLKKLLFSPDDGWPKHPYGTLLKVNLQHLKGRMNHEGKKAACKK